MPSPHNNPTTINVALGAEVPPVRLVVDAAAARRLGRRFQHAHLVTVTWSSDDGEDDWVHFLVADDTALEAAVAAAIADHVAGGGDDHDGDWAPLDVVFDLPDSVLYRHGLVVVAHPYVDERVRVSEYGEAWLRGPTTDDRSPPP